jgi:two-component system, chemotaxis family, protein-glutamate methylesterase/glutaminase
MAQRTIKKHNKAPAKVPAADFPIVVIGASAGGFNTLLELVEHLPIKSDAAVFVVLHLSEHSNASFLIQYLQKHTAFKCRLANHGETIKKHTLYFALRGMHLLFSKGKIVYGTGPDENNHKPSIDVLFRSAAVEFGSRVIGIILTGMMDDGVSGMIAIRNCGGLCIVQDPAEAQYPALPLAVMNNMKPDYSLPVAAMGSIILEALQKPRKKKVVIPNELKEEVEIAQKMLTEISDTQKLGTPSLLTCPDCGGTLFHVKEGKLNRYRCFTGHAYSEANLLHHQEKNINSTLWVALRLMEERKKLLEKYPALGRKNDKSEIEDHIVQLKTLLTGLVKLNGHDDEEKLQVA